MYGPDERLRRLEQLPAPSSQFASSANDPVGAMLIERARQLIEQKKSSAAFTLLESVAPLLTHPRDRISVFIELARLLEESGQHKRAQQLHLAMRLAVARDGRPAVRYWFLMTSFPKTTPAVDSVSFESARIACAARAYTICGNVYASLSSWHLNIGNPREAIRHAERAVRIGKMQPSPYFMSVANIRLGRAYMRTGDYTRAEAVLKEAERLAEAAGSTYMLAEALHNLAHTYENSNRWEPARVHVARFVNAASMLRDPLRVVSLRDAGLIHWDSGHRAAAQDFFERMVRLIDETNSDHYWAGEYYERSGDLRRAHGYYRRALAVPSDTARITAGLVRVYLALQEKDSAQRMAVVHDRASQTPEEVPLVSEVLAARGSFADAVRVAEEWARQKERDGNLVGASNAWLQVGQLRLGNRQFAAAADAANQAAKFASQANLTEQRARALMLLGDVHVAEQKYPEAIAALRNALRTVRQTVAPRLRAQILTSLAVALASHNESREALRIAETALAQFDGIDDRFESDFDRARFASQRGRAYETGLRIVVARRDAAATYQWLQRQKARRGSAAMTVREVQQRLDKGALIDFAITDSVTYALVVTATKADVVTLPIDRRTLRQLVEKLRVPTVAHFGRIDWARATFDTGTAHALYQALLRPLQSHITNAERWYVVADGELHFIPFDALVVSVRPLEFVIDRHEVTYLASNGDVPRATRSRYGATVVARMDAPASEQEEQNVARRMNARSLTSVTEAAVREALKSADIVHFTTHARANPALPLSSYLKLTAGDGGDGYLHIPEIAAARTNAQLIFLSACETQHGRVYAGSGVMGIAQAFLSAGAGTVIATQWPVGASAARVADVFYAKLSGGASASAALRAAKLDLRKRSATQDALHWGAFMVVARSKPVSASRSK